MDSTRKEDTNARQEEDRGQGESQARGQSAQARRGRRRQERLAKPAAPWWTRDPAVPGVGVRSPKAAGFRGDRELSIQTGPSDHATKRRDRRWDRAPRALHQHFRVTVLGGKRRDIQRIQVSSAHPPHLGWSYFTVQDAEYLIRQLQRAIRRAPRAR